MADRQVHVVNTIAVIIIIVLCSYLKFLKTRRYARDQVVTLVYCGNDWQYFQNTDSRPYTDGTDFRHRWFLTNQ